MLTTADYRTSLLQRYRQRRALGATPQQAYRFARAATPPLPDNEAALLANAAAAYWGPLAQCMLTQGWAPRQVWRDSYSCVRYSNR